MMRSMILILPMLALAACDTPAPQPATATPAQVAPFEMPMDPGTINCGQMTNPAALTAGVDWTMGRARAAVLSGRLGTLPDAASVEMNLASYCSANTDRNATLRDAAAQLGL